MSERPNAHAILWRLGYRRIVPIIPPEAPLSPHSRMHKRLQRGDDARGKAPGVRGGDGWHGYDWLAHETEERDLARWHEMGAGAGLVTGQGLAAVDADTLDPALAEIVRQTVLRTVGLAPPSRIGRAPKALYLLAVDGLVPYTCLQFNRQPDGKAERVEILTEGKQFVAAGVHPVTMRPYAWPVPLVARDRLPVVGPAQLAAMMAELRDILPGAQEIATAGENRDRPPIPQEDLRGEPAAVAAAVRAIPNSHARFSSREAYLAVGYAIRAALPDDLETARDIFQEWCARWDGGVNEPDVVEADWNRMRGPYRRGASWLHELAHEAGAPLVRPEAARHFEVPDEPLFPEAEAQDSPQARAAALRGTPWSGRAGASIAPREFLYGAHYQRQYASVTVAPTKVGKSSLGIVEALAMATGRPLLGVQPEGLFRVRIWNGEDPLEEMERRIAAVVQHYGLTREDVGDRLLVDSGRSQPLAIARTGRDGATIYRPVADGVEQALVEQRVDCLIIDPFVKSHRVRESDNMDIDLVAAEWNRIAGATRCAVEIVQHTRKLGGNTSGEATIEDSRGASALVSAARSARVLARMTAEQGALLGRKEDFRSLFRFADFQGNTVPPPRGLDETWYEMVDVDLRNASTEQAERPGGTEKIRVKSDHVGVVVLSRTRGRADAGDIRDLLVDDPQDTPQSEGPSRETRALALLAAHPFKRNSRAGDSWAGVPVCRIYGLKSTSATDRTKAEAILQTWISDGKLREIDRKDPADRKLKTYVEVAPSASIEDAF